MIHLMASYIKRPWVIFKGGRGHKYIVEYFKEKLKTCDYSVKFDVYQMLIELYEEKDYDLACEKLEEYIDKETDNDLKEYLEEMLVDYREY